MLNIFQNCIGSYLPFLRNDFLGLSLLSCILVSFSFADVERKSLLLDIVEWGINTLCEGSDSSKSAISQTQINSIIPRKYPTKVGVDMCFCCCDALSNLSFVINNINFYYILLL